MTEQESPERLVCDGEAGIEQAVAWQGALLQSLGAGRAVCLDVGGCSAMALPFLQWLEVARRSFEAGGVRLQIEDPCGVWAEAKHRAGLAGQEAA